MKPCEKMIIVEGGMIFCGNHHCLLDGVKCEGKCCPNYKEKKFVLSGEEIVDKLREEIENYKKEYQNEIKRIELEEQLGCEKNVKFHRRIKNEVFSNIITLEKFLSDILEENHHRKERMH